MQSFKNFLLAEEELYNSPTFHQSYTYSHANTPHDFRNLSERQLEEIISEKLKNGPEEINVTVHAGANLFTIFFEISFQNEVSIPIVQQLNEMIKNALQEIADERVDGLVARIRSGGALELKGYSKVKIEYFSLNLTIVNDKFQFSEFIKNVDVERLNVINFFKYKNGMMSLFKMPELRRIIRTDIIGVDDKTPMFKIVNSHLAADRNASKCQTELMKTGFKQYAKF